MNMKILLEGKDALKSFWEKRRQSYDTYEALSGGAEPTFEYYVLTILSCLIATVGLIQGSAAVIIGAMIVAPFMTPILAFSLGVIWGDVALMKTSILSLIKGTILVIIIIIFCGI